MNKIKMVLGSTLIISFLFWGNSAFTGELTWQSSREAAFATAKSENKKVLLFGGRDSCGVCKYMRTQVFESMKPPVKDLLEKHYIIWFSDIDKSTEWHRYAGGMSQIALPLICVIDPDSKNVYEDRSTGRQNSPAFYSRLLKYTKE